MQRELALHVDPRRVGALGQRARVVVQDLVQHAEAQVAHADVVDVRKGQAHARIYRAPIFATRAVLRARVAGRLFDALQEIGVGVLEELHGGLAERRRAHIARPAPLRYFAGKFARPGMLRAVVVWRQTLIGVTRHRMFPPGPLLIPKLSGPPELTWRVPGSK